MVSILIKIYKLVSKLTIKVLGTNILNFSKTLLVVKTLVTNS